jgi:hypothetical protein
MFRYLDSLPVLSENIYTHDSLIKIRIGALDDVVVQMFFVTYRVHSFKDEIEQGFQVFRTWTRDEDVAVSVCDRSGNSQSESSRLASTTSSRQCHGRGQRLLGDSVNKSQHSLRLIDGLGQFHQLSDRLCIRKAFFQSV